MADGSGVLETLFEGDAPADVSEVRKKLEAIVNADIRNVMRDTLDGETAGILPKEEWPDQEAMALQSWRETQFGISLTFYDKNKAADMLARMDGLYRKDNEQADPLKQLFNRIPREKLIRLCKELELLDIVEDD